MKLHAGCELVYQAEEPTPLILMLRPRSGEGQWITGETYELEPSVPVTEYTDMYGNLAQRLVTTTGRFRIKTTVDVETADTIDTAPSAPFTPVELLPDAVLPFLLPSRYCQLELNNLAIEIVGDFIPGYDQVEAIRHWIHNNIQYQYGTSDATTSAIETAQQRTGVCRDFAHLGIALCRSLNIPARMVVGYLYELKPMDLHAWFEAFVGERWYAFDATQAVLRANRIIIAYGRDAADVALVTQFGAITLQTMSVWVDSKPST
jgi:transglutaminase-like putative cysteine protease